MIAPGGSIGLRNGALAGLKPGAFTPDDMPMPALTSQDNKDAETDTAPIHPDVDKEETLKEISDNVKEAFESDEYSKAPEREISIERWQAIYRTMMGHKPRVAQPFKSTYIIREVWRQMYVLYAQINQQFFTGSQLFRYDPRHPGGEVQADSATNLAHWQIYHYGYEARFRRWLECALCYGTSYMTYGWQQFQRKWNKPKEWIDDDTLGTWWDSNTEEIVEEAPWFDFIAPSSIISHPRYEEVRESPYVFWRKAISPANVKTLIREGYLDAKRCQKAADDQDAQASQRELDEMREESPGMRSHSELSNIFPTDAPLLMSVCWSTNGWEVVKLGDSHVVRCQKLQNDEIPLLALRNYPQIGEHHGYGEPLVIMEDQRFMNDASSMLIDSFHYQYNPMMKVKQRARQAWARSVFKPGGKVELEDMGDIEPLQWAVDGPTQLIQMIEFFSGKMQDYTGLNNKLDGSAPNTGTATGMVKLQNAAGLRMQDKVRTFIPGFRELYRTLYNLNQENLRTEQFYRLEGEDGKRSFMQGGPEAFQADVDVDVVLADLMEGDPEKIAKWMQFGQFFGQDPIVNKKAMLERILRGMGERKPKIFINDPATAQIAASSENADWEAYGQMPEPNPTDNHQLHLQTHAPEMRTPEYADPLRKGELDRHMALHQGYLQAQQQAAAQAQAAQGGAMGPPKPSGQGGVQDAANARTKNIMPGGAQASGGGQQ